MRSSCIADWHYSCGNADSFSVKQEVAAVRVGSPSTAACWVVVWELCKSHTLASCHIPVRRAVPWAKIGAACFLGK